MIPSLMAVERTKRDIDWLRKALQWAVELEFSTSPPYLSGMWSIIDEGDPVRGYLSDIVLQEMLHMGLACNMLCTLEGLPKIASALPTYPGPLPGGVRPELRLWLAGLSRAMVRAVYMEIEYPENGPIAKFLDEEYPTIGNFYSAILEAFRNLPASAFKNVRQCTAPGLGGVGLFRIDCLAAAERAITIIKEQGEGTSVAPFPSEDPEGRAHYYQFAEIYFGRRLVKADGQWGYTGDEIRMPPAFPMAEVPEAGYGAITRQFNEQYTDVVNLLQSAWETAQGQSSLDRAVLLMPSLGSYARDLMGQALPNGSGNYGPDFKLISVRKTA
jgi:hypothetical protein